MAITTQQPPASSGRALQEALQVVLTRPQTASSEAMRSPRLSADAISYADPIRDYALEIDAVAGNPALDQARPVGWRYWIVGDGTDGDLAAGVPPAEDTANEVSYDLRWSGMWLGLPYAVRARVIKSADGLALSIASTSAGTTMTGSVPLTGNAIVTLPFDRLTTVVTTAVDPSRGTDVITLDLEITIRAQLSPIARIASEQVVLPSIRRAAPPAPSAGAIPVPIGEASVIIDPAGNARFAGLTVGPTTAAVASALAEIEKSPRVCGRDYELRSLRIPPLRFYALWLHATDDDLIAPCTPTPESVISRTPTTAQEVFAVLQPRARKLLALAAKAKGPSDLADLMRRGNVCG